MTKRQHRWYKPEEKMEMVQKFLGSELTLTKFCKNQEISKSTLYAWVKIYNESYKTSQKLPLPSFQNVSSIIKQEINQVNISTKIKLTLPNNIIIEFESKELHNVLQELK